MAVPEQRLPYSRSLADIRAEQAGNLERLRSRLNDVNVRDLVPMLVARQVLRSYEMGAVYSQVRKYLINLSKISKSVFLSVHKLNIWLDRYLYG